MAQDPTKPRVARVVGSDDLYIMAASEMRAVQVPAKGVAELVGKQRHRLQLADVRLIAEELLQKPALAYGRFMLCEEMFDADRTAPPQSNGPSAESSDPYGLDRDPDHWKQDSTGEPEGPQA